MMKKVHESFRVYAQKWRELAAQVKPPMAEKEMVNAFLNTLKEPYYSHLLGHTTSSFADLVIVGERVEDGIKTGKLIDVQALQSLIEQSGASASARRPNPRRVETGPKGGEVQNLTSAPPRNNLPQKQAVYLQLAPIQPLVFTQPPVTPISPPTAQAQAINAPPPAQAVFRKELRKFDPLPVPMSQLLPQLLAANLLTVIPPRMMTEPLPKWYNPDVRCDYHTGSPRHWTDSCYNLKHRIQDLLDKRLLVFEVKPENKPNITQNPLPAHGNANQAGPARDT